MKYDLKAAAKRMAERYNAKHKPVEVSDVVFLVDCHTLCLAPNVQPTDEIGYQSAYAQKVLREVFDDIVDANSGMGYVVLKDNTIRCITSSSYVAQFDGCLESEISFHMDR